MKNYSQNNEQEVILNYFKSIGVIHGCFLDLGANDGVTFSNTRALYDLGWDGIYIEASPKAFAKLHANNDRALASYNLAITSFDGVLSFNESGNLIGENDVSLVGTFHVSEMDRFKKVVSYNRIEVKSLTWRSFLEKTPYKKFDFISMDIEGSELEVLPFMDLSGTKCFCIEWNGKETLKKEYDKYINGFKVIHTNAENIIYAR